MHPYSIDTRERPKVYLSLGALSLGIVLLIQSVLPDSGPWKYLGAPSVLAVFSLLFGVFDHYLWRFPVLRKIGLVKIPDLQGVWQGHVMSSHDDVGDGDGESHEVTVRIEQRWSKISIELEAETSNSHSRMGAFHTQKSVTSRLEYAYLNEPNQLADPDMQSHRGTAWFRLEKEGRRLVGGYYTDRGRQNVGEIDLTWEGKLSD